MTHTILLMQSTNKKESRTWADYETTNECMESICKIYEEHLKKLNPDKGCITYDISALFKFIDLLEDLCCLVFDDKAQVYAPKSKDWIKNEIFLLLRRQAAH
uniref:Enhancer of rudimentary homolog n=1 Tax=Acrobeloides nanus TaxID=290746 RepID=A0A914DYJ5_9BILA